MTAFTNAAPAAPTGVTLIGGTKSITVRWNDCTDHDYDFSRVEWATSSNGAYTLFGTVHGSTLEITGLNHSTTYFIRVAHVDSFGPTLLNYSTPLSTTTNNFNSEVDARIGTAVINGSQLVGQSIPQSALSTAALYAPLAVIGDVRNFVRNSLGDRGTDGWIGSNISTSTNEAWSTYSANQYKGSAALIFDNRDAVYGDLVPVQQGDQFWVSMANIPRGGGVANYPITIGLAVYNKDKVAFNWVGVTRPTTVSGYQLLQGSVTVSHSDAVYVRPWVSIVKTANTFTGGTVGDGVIATAITVTRKNKGELIVDGSIYGNHIGANTVTADKIDSRGLSIKDASGNVIFAAGTALSPSLINAGRQGNLLHNTENSSNENYIGRGWTAHTNLTALNAEMTYATGLTVWPGGNEWFPLNTNPIVMYQTGTAGSHATNYAEIRSDHIPVIPGQRYEASCYIQSHRCFVRLYLVFLDESGNTNLGSFNSGGTIGTSWELGSFTSARDISQWNRLTVFGTAPANARSVKFYFRKFVTNDTETVNLSSYAWMLFPYLGVAGVNQTTFNDYSPGSEWVPNGTIRPDNKISSSNISTYINSAAIDEAYINIITANKIDSRNLTIKDAAGNVIFGSGANLDWSRISASAGWLNSNIGISSGALTGIGTGTGTVVANSNISIDGGGVLNGIGTGNGNTVANFAIGVNGSGLITGIGTGTNTPVSNNVVAQYGNLLTNTENKSNENPTNKGWIAAHTVAGLGASTTITTEQLRSPTTPWDWQPIGANATVINQVGTAAGAPTDYTDWCSDYVAVTPSTNYEYSCYLQTHRCKTELYLVWYDQSNAYIGASYGGVANNVSLGGGTTARNISNWARLGGISPLPSNCVSVRLFIRKYRTDSGQADSFSWHLYPYVGRAGSSQTTLSQFSPGAEWVPNGTIRPDNKLTTANISNYMNNAVIGQALIGNLAVGTLQIQNNAVTIPSAVVNSSYYLNQTVNFNFSTGINYLNQTINVSDYILLAQLTYTSSGASVILQCNVGCMPNRLQVGFDTNYSRLLLYRGTVSAGTVVGFTNYDCFQEGVPGILNVRDVPASGSVTYSLYIQIGTTGANTTNRVFGSSVAYCSRPSIIALETKK
jgi:hypothetical protein